MEKSLSAVASMDVEKNVSCSTLFAPTCGGKEEGELLHTTPHLWISGRVEGCVCVPHLCLADPLDVGEDRLELLQRVGRHVALGELRGEVEGVGRPASHTVRNRVSSAPREGARSTVWAVHCEWAGGRLGARVLRVLGDDRCGAARVCEEDDGPLLLERLLHLLQ